MPPVTIYTTPVCHFCHATKEFFKEHNVVFTEKDASNPQVAQEMIQKSGQLGVPVIEIGKDLVIGFNRKRLAELLNITV
jgi:glutaredoxin